MKGFTHTTINNNSSNAVYGLGLIGSLVYYFQHASSLSDAIWGLIKAFFWPAFVIYKVLETLNV